jgi:hypothetical protein
MRHAAGHEEQDTMIRFCFIAVSLREKRMPRTRDDTYAEGGPGEALDEASPANFSCAARLLAIHRVGINRFVRVRVTG